MDKKIMFNVRLPEDILETMRKYTKESGIKIWKIVADSLRLYFKTNKVK